MTILPTHTCFDDALDWLSEKVVKERKLELVLVHGIQLVTTAEQGDVRFAHAWVEDMDGLCWDFGIIQETGDRISFAVQREEYYRDRRVQAFTRYTAYEACKENFLSNHYGPWKAEYRELCGKGDRRRFVPVERGP